MIFEAIQLLQAELRAYLNVKQRDPDLQVEVGSVASSPEDKLLLTLVNVEEEAALKNTSPYQRNATGGYDLVNPPVFLNLYVLVSASCRDNTTYATALRRLAWTVQCFQQKNTVTPATAPASALTGTVDPAALRLRLSLDLYSLSFEKLSQLWATLGGKQQPCVLYKVRVVEEQGSGQLGQGPAITTIEQRPTTLTPSSAT